MPTDPRFLAAAGREVFTGNELLLKGMLEVEGGVHLLTGYPGSPIAGFFDAASDVKDLLQEKGIRAFQANNEALASAAVNGAQMVGLRAIAAMKNVGVHVASDALALGNLAGAHPEGGAVIIMGEDPWCESTQVPADSRFICEHLRMPAVEAGTPQQLKDWIDLCFKLSRAGGCYIGYIVTVAMADGGGTVRCRPNQFPAVNTKQRLTLQTDQIDLDKVLLPPRTWQHELAMPQRFAATVAAARELGINSLEAGWTDDASPAPLGFIVTGVAGSYLRHVLSEVGLEGRFPILTLGMSYPVDVDLVRELAGRCQHMIVVEERRGFLERNIRDAVSRTLPPAQAAELGGRLFGKRFPDGKEGIPDARGLNYSVLAQKILPLIQSTPQVPPELRNGRLSGELSRLRRASAQRLEVVSQVVPRTPTFCPGCPHRDSAATLLDLRRRLNDPAYMRQRHGRGPVDLVAHGDTGCYTMLMFAPTTQLMHNYSGMGLGGGTGSGVDPFITNKQIVFMGDSTFFHSGLIAITNSIKAGQDLTYIILDNGTTAMTGHQGHAGSRSDVDEFGNRHTVQDIYTIVKGIAATAPLRVVKLSPADRDRYGRVLEETILADGVKVIIADKECGITFHRQRAREERRIIREHGYLPRKTYMNITPEVCENCLECTRQTACPGLTVIDTDYGPKIDTDLTWCVNDGACERVRISNDYGADIKPCPSFEEVTVVRRRRRRYLLPNMSLDKLPEPRQVVHDMSRPGSQWRCHMSGVGGMGIGLVAAILVRAGHKEGYHVLFQDKKGLAIRNGGVYSQVTFVSQGAEGSGFRVQGSVGEERHQGTETRRHEGTEAHSALSTQDSALREAVGTEARRHEGPGTGPIENRKSKIENPPQTASIPFGRADLLLGVDILEAARAVDPQQSFRVASSQHTAAVLNLYKQPTVNLLLGEQDFDPDALREEIFARCHPEHRYANNLSEICERRLGSKQFVNIMMLGVAYQLGLIPVSARSIAWAIRDTIKREHRRNLKAFNIGRKLALEPRVLPRKPQPETWEQLLTNKARILRRTRLRGRAWAARYEALVRAAIERMSALDERSRYDLTLRIYDVLQYQDDRLARRYVDLVAGIYARDSAERAFAATAAAIHNLAKVILIKDEVYVSYLLTRYEKKQRDLAKYNVDTVNGDRLVYRHHTSPEFNIGPWRIRLRLTTRDWMLRLVRPCKWLRRIPGWHWREAQFRDWYISLLPRLDLASDSGYRRALDVLRCPEQVSGYREVRYPKMDRVRQTIEQTVLADELSPPAPATGLLAAMRRPSHA